MLKDGAHSNPRPALSHGAGAASRTLSAPVPQQDQQVEDADRAAGPASFASAVSRSPRRTIGVDYLVAILHDKGLANYKGYHIQSADTSTGQDIAVITKLTPDTISGQKIRNFYSAGCGIRLPHGQA